MVQILGLLHARRGQTGEQTTASPSAIEEDQVTGLQPVHSISFEINNVPEFVSTGGVDVMRLRFHNLAHFDEHRASPWWHEHSISSRRMYPSDIVSHIFIVYRPNVVDFFLREAAYFEGLKSRWYAMQWYSVKDEPLAGSAVVFWLGVCPVFWRGASGHDDIQPIVCSSPNHLGWIEEITEPQGVKWAGGKKKWLTRRVFRLLEFPEPGVNVYNWTARPGNLRTLKDVPEAVLKRAVRAFLEPALASVFILTEEGNLHRFKYA